MPSERLEKVLFVDDEPNVLAGIKRQLYSKYQVYTAESGAKGLECIQNNGPFAVVVSDMRMPVMSGAVLLSKVKDVASSSMRILLTGQTDIDSAVSAINEGEIFRFLLKPCPNDVLVKALEAAIEQRRLLRVEKELLEKTLQGSIKVLTDILSLVNPLAFSRSSKIRQYVKHMAMELGLSNRWQYELAAMLSQIGCVVVPPEILMKIYGQQGLTYEEKTLFNSHPNIGYDLIAKIPRLKTAAQMIQHQQDMPELDKPIAEWGPGLLGGQMLKVALALDEITTAGSTLQKSMTILSQQETTYHPELVKLLANFKDDQSTETRQMLEVKDLTLAMIIDEDIKSTNGTLVVSKGQEVTEAMLARLQIMSRNMALHEPFMVIIR